MPYFERKSLDTGADISFLRSLDEAVKWALRHFLRSDVTFWECFILGAGKLYGRLPVRLRFSANCGELRVVYGGKVRSLPHFVSKFEAAEFKQLEAQTADLNKQLSVYSTEDQRKRLMHHRNSGSASTPPGISRKEPEEYTRPGTTQEGYCRRTMRLNTLSPFRRTWRPAENSFKKADDREFYSVDAYSTWGGEGLPLDPNSVAGAAQKFVDRLRRQRRMSPAKEDDDSRMIINHL